ncbi:glycoside hydrolase family 3 N-terminal domain-containing protein [Oerskovia sp. M15]
MSTQVTSAKPWQDPGRTAAERVEDLVERMTVEEKIAQLVGVWVGADASGGGSPAPGRHDVRARSLGRAGPCRLGQLTRPFGSAPSSPSWAPGRSLRRRRTSSGPAGSASPPRCTRSALPGSPSGGPRPTRPALVGCLVRPRARGAGRRAHRHLDAGSRVHQGLAPVLDVTRDYRWGRTEETIGEDPYLVGTVGAAYVRGLEGSGVVATLKHFAGYSASRSGRNLAPVSIGPRELADVVLPPFEMALRLGGARSVMHSYTEIDGVPSAADTRLLTGLLREQWGFTGTVVADYFGIRFLETLHGVADGRSTRHGSRSVPGWTSSCPRWTRSAQPSSRPCTPGRSTRRSSTGRCAGS